MKPAKGQYRCRTKIATPALEPARRRARIDPRADRSVVQRVLQHVAQRPLHLERRAQEPREEAVAEALALAVERAVQALGDPDREALHRSRQRDLVARLDDQVQVVRLHRELADARAEALGRREDRALDDAVELARAQARQPLDDLHRDVRRHAIAERGARHVRHTTFRGRTLAPSARALAAVLRPRVVAELELLRPHAPPPAGSACTRSLRFLRCSRSIPRDHLPASVVHGHRAPSHG